jgi:hypothetical protein
MRLPALIATSVIAVITVAGCAAGGDHAGPGRPSPGPPNAVPPTGPASGGPPPLTVGSAPAMPPLTPTGPVAGTRARAVPWTPAGRSDDGRLLMLDVAVGGPPCDAVTAVDVVEASGSVTVTVHAGVVTGADCTGGIPAIIGTVRVAARLAQPLGTRTLVDGAKR